MTNKLCETCIYKDNYELEKPCIIYRDDCELYEKAREYMSKQFFEMIDRYESNGHELKFIDHNAILIRCKDCDHCLNYGDCLVCNRGALDISADDFCSKAERKRDETDCRKAR